MIFEIASRFILRLDRTFATCYKSTYMCVIAGGGWTLVVSISSSNNDHLNRGVVNCLLPNRCVENVTSDIPTRKMSDEEIHEIATTEGKFRGSREIPKNWSELMHISEICKI